ncbi:MAG: hypothetical protein QM800_14740 [Paludibacter sp.]
MKQKTLVFHIGCSAGFYSEYLEMLAAIVYCRVNNIEFKLYSGDANFSVKYGWTDYFEPFCEEVNDEVHHKYNLRFIFPSLSRLVLRKIFRKSPIPKWCWQKLSWWYLKVFLTAPYYKHKYNFTYYTHDLWFKIQKLKKKSGYDYLRLEQQALINTWRFNRQTQNEIDEIINSLQLPHIYIGTQIRAGDKSSEQECF